MDQQPRRSAPPRTDNVISRRALRRATTTSRAEHGVNRVLYMIVRLILVRPSSIWFRLQRTGREHARVKGGMIVASNHRSFLDPFVIGALLPWRRQIQFVAKVELFEKRWQGWILSRLGAFPIRRGQSDEVAMETARLAVERGGTVVHLPRGHPASAPARSARPSAASAGSRWRSGATVLPVAVHGSEHVRTRLAHPAAQGQAARRHADDLPADRAPVARARGDRDRPDLAEHRAPVGVAGRPAAAAQGRRDRRRQLGHRRRGAARARRRSRSSSAPAPRRRPRRSPGSARTRSTCPA